MTVQDGIRNKFLLNAHRVAQMSDEEADDMAAFFDGVGTVMIDQLTPVLNSYRERIADRLRNEVIEEIVMDFHGANGMILTKGSIITRLRSHKR